MLAIRIDSVKNPPWGIAGGMAGGIGPRAWSIRARTDERALRAVVGRQHAAARRRPAHRDRRRRRLGPSASTVRPSTC